MSLAARLSALATASLFEAAGKRGAMDAGIKPLVGSEKIAGRAVTAETPAGDNLVLHQILAGTFSGEILVVDGKSECRIALWGEVMTAAAQAVGLAALVVDGVVRDAVAISSTGFPIYARGLAIPALPRTVAAKLVSGSTAVAYRFRRATGSLRMQTASSFCLPNVQRASQTKPSKEKRRNAR